MRHINANRSPNSGLWLRYAGQERRAAPRIETPFPTTVRGVDVDGRWFESHVVLDNLSSGGLYVRLAQPVQQGIRLCVFVRLSVVPDVEDATACIALQGAVLRTEPRPGGVFGTAIRLRRHRFIYMKFKPEWSRTAGAYSVPRTSDSSRLL
jgi:hypothetical protein